MELTDLRHFANVAAAGSFSRGAVLSHVTTPAVSKSVRKLEAELDVRLFERTTRRVALTAEGCALLDRVTRIFGELDSLRAELEGRAARIEGELRIAAMEVLSIDLLPRALASLMRVHRELRPITYEMVPEAMQRALREGRVEVGLTIGGADAPGIASHELGRSEGVLVCGRTHPLYGKRRIGPRQLREHPSVVPRFLGLEHLPPLDQFPEEAWERSVGATIELLQMGVRLCEEGVVLGYFPEISVRGQLAAGTLHALAGLPKRTPFVLRALTREGATWRPAARALVEAVTECVAAAARAPRRPELGRGH
jgi:DNA-binding transcriptional LysR family regulator